MTLKSITSLLLIIPLVLISFTATEITAGNWQFEQRCIPEPVAPPDSWSYPGTLLMMGYAGIHGMQADWDTPHVMVFFRRDRDGDVPIDGGQLSPDGLWYATPIGEIYQEVSFNVYFFAEKVRVYSTTGDNQIFEFSLSDYSDIYVYATGAWTILPVEWRDSKSLVVGKLLFSPFAQRIEEADFNLYSTELSPSPDLTRLYGDFTFDFKHETILGLYDLVNQQPLDTDTERSSLDSLSWRRDSQGFIAVTPGSPQALLYFDRDGQLIEELFSLGESTTGFRHHNARRNDANWSPDNMRFAFVTEQYLQPNRLHIIDWETHTITDTCLNPIEAPVWSPDGDMLAYLTPAARNLKLVVVDLQAWIAYDVARHINSGNALGSGMVGWRESQG